MAAVKRSTDSGQTTHELSSASAATTSNSLSSPLLASPPIRRPCPVYHLPTWIHTDHTVKVTGKNPHCLARSASNVKGRLGLAFAGQVGIQELFNNACSRIAASSCIRGGLLRRVVAEYRIQRSCGGL